MIITSKENAIISKNNNEGVVPSDKEDQRVALATSQWTSGAIPSSSNLAPKC